VPRVESYAVVAFSAGDALTAATDLANARRAIRRIEIIRGQPDAAAARRVQKRSRCSAPPIRSRRSRREGTGPRQPGRAAHTAGAPPAGKP